MQNKVNVLVTAAVTNNGHALVYASDELKNNKRVVTAVVTQSGGTLRLLVRSTTTTYCTARM